MLSGIGPSSGDAAAREQPRAPPAIGFGVDLDRAAHADDGPALVALRRSRRRLDRHSALTRRQHPVSLLARAGWSHRLGTVPEWGRAAINSTILFLSPRSINLIRRIFPAPCIFFTWLTGLHSPSGRIRNLSHGNPASRGIF